MCMFQKCSFRKMKVLYSQVIACSIQLDYTYLKDLTVEFDWQHTFTIRARQL